MKFRIFLYAEDACVKIYQNCTDVKIGIAVPLEFMGTSYDSTGPFKAKKITTDLHYVIEEMEDEQDA